MSQPLRLAFFGVDHPHGSGWRELLRHFPEEIELTAIVPGLSGSIHSLEERFAHLPRYATADELLAKQPFDAAMICLSNRESPGVTKKLAEAGKHLLLEKPGAARWNDFQDSAHAIETACVVFQSGYLWRYDPIAQRLRQMVADGRFGELISLEAGLFTADVQRRGPSHFLFDAADTGPVGFFHWLMCHFLDLLLYITNQPVVAVTAKVGRFGSSNIPMDDGGTAILELANGALATLTGGYWLPRWTGEAHWTIRGTERWVHWNQAKPGTKGELLVHGPQPHFMAMNETFTLPPDNTTGYAGSQGVQLIRDWLTAIRTGQNSSPISLASTIATLQLLDTVYESSETGRRIECRIEP